MLNRDGLLMEVTTGAGLDDAPVSREKRCLRLHPSVLIEGKRAEAQAQATEEAQALALPDLSGVSLRASNSRTFELSFMSDTREYSKDGISADRVATTHELMHPRDNPDFGQAPKGESGDNAVAKVKGRRRNKVDIPLDQFRSIVGFITTFLKQKVTKTPARQHLFW